MGDEPEATHFRMANTTASLEEQFETCAPAVEFADGENGQTLALLQHKDLGKIAIDCNTCMFTSWQSSSNYPKLRQEAANGFQFCGHEVLSWQVVGAEGGTDPEAPCSVTLESFLGEVPEESHKVVCTVTLGGDFRSPFIKVQLSVESNEAAGPVPSVKMVLGFRTAGAARSEGPVKILGMQNQEFIDLSEPAEPVKDEAEQWSIRPAAAREYHYQPVRANKKFFTLNLDDGPDSMIVRAARELNTVRVRADAESERWPNYVDLELEGALNDQLSTYVEIKSRY